ncbi:MAG TPA: SulP family inorganic anion transporter [Tepidisphaeraceae bacterium]|nr:SulP family inorganic anion transporter [Tepidisphaeraceae bacterium]
MTTNALPPLLTPAAAPVALTGGRGRWSAAPAWLAGYRGSWFRADLIAGVTLAAYLIPAGLGDASLANLPPEAGLYACLFSGLVFWLFCSSRHTAITVTSAISLVVGASLGDLAGGDAGRFRDLAAATALLVAAIGIIAWLVSAGAIVTFISESVMVGFKCGVALFLASTQLPKLFGFSGAHGGSFWERAGHFGRHLGDTNRTALLVGLVALGVLIAGKIFLKHRPVALFVVIAGIAATPLLGLAGHGVKLLGPVPAGLPAVHLPAVGWDDINALLPLAFACFLLGAVETVAIGRMFGPKHGNRLDANRELLALAASNLAAGVGRGFPVSGGMSQSLVNEGGGARSPLSGLIAAVVILLVTVFLSGALRDLPQPVLAAIVLVAVAGLFKVEALRHLWRADRTEFVTAAVALLGVLGSGLLRGVLIGAVISLVLLIRRASRPHVAQLGRIPGTRRFSDLARHPDNEPVPGVMIFRPQSGLVYFNVEHVCDAVANAVAARPEAPRLAVLDLSASPMVDVQSAEALATLADGLARRGTCLRVVEARAPVRDRLRAVGADAKLGGVDRFSTIADLLDSDTASRQADPPPRDSFPAATDSPAPPA